jgi:catechol 2,3-dioxygenase-like lactoylglutathione lyase family enzyme
MLGDCTIVPMLATTKPDDARRFYSEALGLELLSEDPFAIIYRTGETTLRLQKVAACTPHPFSVLGWRVPDLRAAVTALAAKGVRFERFEGMAQDELGVWTPPGTSYGVCWFKDPEGHLLSLTG